MRNKSVNRISDDKLNKFFSKMNNVTRFAKNVETELNGGPSVWWFKNVNKGFEMSLRCTTGLKLNSQNDTPRKKT